MNHGISVAGYHSLDDFGWRLIDRVETPPQLRTTKVTVPYANGTLDYTGVYGEPFYGESPSSTPSPRTSRASAS